MGVSQNYGYLFGGPNNKDYSILGSILGFPLFWETTISTLPLQVFCGVGLGAIAAEMSC